MFEVYGCCELLTAVAVLSYDGRSSRGERDAATSFSGAAPQRLTVGVGGNDGAPLRMACAFRLPALRPLVPPGDHYGVRALFAYLSWATAGSMGF